MTYSSYVLPGGGPWRILTQCPAIYHNSLMAGLGRNKGPHCVCPRALDLTKDMSIGARRREIPKWLTDGPWRILDECEAPSHNTISAARGVVKRNQYGTRCVCPRARFLLQDMRKAENGRRKDVTKKRKAKVKLEEAFVVLMNVRDMPDLTDGACMREENRFSVDAGFNEDRTGGGAKDRQLAKDVCDQCPMQTFLRCAEWVREKESPRGAWGGVYAGRDIYERAGVKPIGRRKVNVIP